jgi:4-oxalocrotonate tautomerase
METHMPIITVKFSSSHKQPALEQEIAHLVTSASTTILGKRPELTAVIVERVALEIWIAGGRSLAEQRKASFWLEIKVVDGTNTKDQKEAFIAAVFDTMQNLLGDVHPESYVRVDEVSADGYGFGGLTQERRYIAAKLEQSAPATTLRKAG